MATTGSNFKPGQLPRPAPHLRDLPRNHQGFPVAAESSPFRDGVYNLTKIDPSIKLLLAAYRTCSVCGFPVPPAESVWRVYDETSRQQTHLEIAQGEVIDNDIPGHLVCMLYSALVCPFWRSAGGKLSKDTMFTPGSSRGQQPAIIGFRDYGFLIDPTKPLAGPGVQSFGTLLKDYEGEILFDDPGELADRYHQLRQSVGGRYVTTKRRHYAPVFGGDKRLWREAREVGDHVSRRGPDRRLHVNGFDVGLLPAAWMPETL
jgi:hypothetical protein